MIAKKFSRYQIAPIDSQQMSEHYTHVGEAALKKSAESVPDFAVMSEIAGMAPLG